MDLPTQDIEFRYLIQIHAFRPSKQFFLKLRLYCFIVINILFYNRNCSVKLWFLYILKGSAIIGMLEAVMGQNTFFEGVGVRFYTLQIGIWCYDCYSPFGVSL